MYEYPRLDENHMLILYFHLKKNLGGTFCHWVHEAMNRWRCSQKLGDKVVLTILGERSAINGKVTKFSESTSNSRFIYFTIRDWPELAAAVTFSKREGQAGQGLSPHPRNVSVKYLVH